VQSVAGFARYSLNGLIFIVLVAVISSDGNPPGLLVLEG
jgi:hypothetical protein